MMATSDAIHQALTAQLFTRGLISAMVGMFVKNVTAIGVTVRVSVSRQFGCFNKFCGEKSASATIVVVNQECRHAIALMRNIMSKYSDGIHSL